MREFIIKTERLNAFYNPALRRLCEECPNYGRVYSCPPFEFEPNALLRKSQTYIITETASNSAERAKKQIKLDNELKSRFAVVFSAGCCIRCDKCKREAGEACDDFLYSTEALCIDMFALYEHLTGEALSKDGFMLMYIAQD